MDKDVLTRMANLLKFDDKDPTDELGFGVTSWMKLLRFLMRLFLFFSVIAGYLMYTNYTSGKISGGSLDMIA